MRKTIAKRSKAASEYLKACSSWIEKESDKRSVKVQKEWPLDATVAALRISGELTNWPRLSSENLHPFRLRVKEMRYLLQLSGEENELTNRLGEVKDRIGEWHDWTELKALAKEVLADCKTCEVVARIEQIAKQKFETALRSAQQLRNKYFESKGGTQKQSRKKLTIKKPVLNATAAFAA